MHPVTAATGPSIQSSKSSMWIAWILSAPPPELSRCRRHGPAWKYPASR